MYKCCSLHLDMKKMSRVHKSAAAQSNCKALSIIFIQPLINNNISEIDSLSKKPTPNSLDNYLPSYLIKTHIY